MKPLLSCLLSILTFSSAAVEVYYEPPAEKPPAIVTHFDAVLINTAKDYPGAAILPTPVCTGNPEEKGACLTNNSAQIIAGFNKQTYCQAYVEERVTGQIVQWNQ